MARYYNRRCPFCDHLLDHEIPAWDYALILGPNRQTCPQCGEVSLTGRSFWNELSFEQKHQAIKGLLIAIIIYGVLFFVLLATCLILVGNQLLGLPVEDEVGQLLLLLSLILSIGYHSLRLKRLNGPQPKRHSAAKEKT